MMSVFKYLVYLIVLLSGDVSSPMRESEDYNKLISKNKMEVSNEK